MIVHRDLKYPKTPSMYVKKDVDALFGLLGLTRFVHEVLATCLISFYKRLGSRKLYLGG